MIYSISPVYLDTIECEIELGKLYISKMYKVAIHLFACGCGGKTVTPLKDNEWQLHENNGLVSLTPSIGNWMNEKPYHAHYFITNNQIKWC